MSSITAIESIEAIVVNVSPKTNWTFVSVRTDTGVTGWGECSLGRWETLLTAYVAVMAADLVGRDVASVLAGLRYLPHSPGGLVAHAVRSAIEQAITDCLAQMRALPIHRTIGKTQRSSVPAYANINRGAKSRSPEGFADAARGALAAGYKSIKLAPFDGVIAEDAASTPIDERIRQGLDRVFAVRDAIGPAVPLLVDCHWRFDESRAVALIADIADAAPYWLECPVSEHRSQFAVIARLRKLAHERGMQLAGGEKIVGPDEAAAMCESALYDVLMPDVKYAGGYRGMLAIAAICDANGVAFSPHNPTGPIAHLASVQVCAAAPRVLWLEHQWAESPMFDALTGGCAAPLVDGAFVVPGAPGLGAALDLPLAQSHPFIPLPRNANLDERLG
jgi:galactonate dehydratase